MVQTLFHTLIQPFQHKSVLRRTMELIKSLLQFLDMIEPYFILSTLFYDNLNIVRVACFFRIVYHSVALEDFKLLNTSYLFIQIFHHLKCCVTI